METKDESNIYYVVNKVSEAKKFVLVAVKNPTYVLLFAESERAYKGRQKWTH